MKPKLAKFACFGNELRIRSRVLPIRSAKLVNWLDNAVVTLDRGWSAIILLRL
ncbi:MAG: hypothetical protein ACKVHE_04635 [Planctomycetales bacterium]